MEKLIELLNEYSKKKHNIAMRELNWELWQWFHYLNYWSSYSELLMVSKKYEFIKWLVDNNKIDYQKSPWEIMFDDRMWTTFSLEDSIVMMLSISNSPIEDLISYLK